MVVELIDKLIDRAIQLVTAHNVAKRNLFENFIEPTYSLFQLVHEDYLNCFNRYRATIDSAPDFNSNIIEELCATIKKDNLFTEHRRANLRAFQAILDDNPDDSRIKSFIGAIWFYLYESIAYIHGTEGTVTDVSEAVGAQIYRNSLINALNEISSNIYLSNSESKSKALKELDDIVYSMQGKEGYVTYLYLELKVHQLK